MKKNERKKTVFLFGENEWSGFITEVLRAFIFACINVEIKTHICKPNLYLVVNIYLKASPPTRLLKERGGE
jgi:hypothetical protein